MDSSEEKIGKVDVDRSRNGGIDGLEDDRILLEDCGRMVSTEDCRVVGVGGCRTGGSHMDLFLMTIADIRCIYSSLQFHSLPLLVSQIVETIDQTDHSVKADLSMANWIDAYHRKNVRF